MADTLKTKICPLCGGTMESTELMAKGTVIRFPLVCKTCHFTAENPQAPAAPYQQERIPFPEAADLEDVEKGLSEYYRLVMADRYLLQNAECSFAVENYMRCSKCEDCGHEMYFDNYYASPSIVYTEDFKRAVARQYTMGLGPLGEEFHRHSESVERQIDGRRGFRYRSVEELRRFKPDGWGTCTVCGSTNVVCAPEDNGSFVGGKRIYVLSRTRLNPSVPMEKLLEQESLRMRAAVESGKFKYFSSLRETCAPQEKKLAEEKLALTKQSYDLPQVGLLPNPKAVKDDPEALTQYLGQLLTLETNLIALERWLAPLYAEQRTAESLCRQYIAFGLKSKKQAVADLEQDLQGQLSYNPTTGLQCERFTPRTFELPDRPQKPTLQKPGMFNKKKVEAENAELLRKHDAAVAEYNRKVAEIEALREQDAAECERKNAQAQVDFEESCRRLIEKHKAGIRELQADLDAANEALQEAQNDPNALQGTAVLARKELIDSDVAKAEELLQKTYQTRNALYAANIVFEKYRDPVALASFYEYMMSGRCTKLEGPDGAYNLYEAEVRADLVIAQLSEVIKNLEQIRKNQFMIYQKLNTINESVGKLNYTMQAAVDSLRSMDGKLDAIAGNTAVTAHNTAVTAYYTKMNAELTAAVGMMVALK